MTSGVSQFHGGTQKSKNNRGKTKHYLHIARMVIDCSDVNTTVASQTGAAFMLAPVIMAGSGYTHNTWLRWVFVMLTLPFAVSLDCRAFECIATIGFHRIGIVWNSFPP